MYCVALVSDIHDWHSDQLELNLRRQDCRVFKIKYTDLVLRLQNSKKRIFNSHFKKIHGVWTKKMASKQRPFHQIILVIKPTLSANKGF